MPRQGAAESIFKSVIGDKGKCLSYDETGTVFIPARKESFTRAGTCGAMPDRQQVVATKKTREGECGVRERDGMAIVFGKGLQECGDIFWC